MLVSNRSRQGSSGFSTGFVWVDLGIPWFIVIGARCTFGAVIILPLLPAVLLLFGVSDRGTSSISGLPRVLPGFHERLLLVFFWDGRVMHRVPYRLLPALHLSRRLRRRSRATKPCRRYVVDRTAERWRWRRTEKEPRTANIVRFIDCTALNRGQRH